MNTHCQRKEVKSFDDKILLQSSHRFKNFPKKTMKIDTHEILYTRKTTIRTVYQLQFNEIQRLFCQ